MIDVSSSAHFVGDCRELLARLPEASVQTCVTSPPYWSLRDYGNPGQIGLEPKLADYIVALVGVFRGVRRALRDDGTIWVNIGDQYAGSGRGGFTNGTSTLDGSTAGQDESRRARGSMKAAGYHAPLQAVGAVGRAWVPPPEGCKQKDLIGIPWTLAFALRDDGWWLRSEVIWGKTNAHPESVNDRPTKAHEQVFLLSKSSRYFYDKDAIREPLPKKFRVRDRALRRTQLDAKGNPLGANARSVWMIPTKPYKGAHFATMPPRLAERCVLSATRRGDIVLDPFFGSGTTGEVAQAHGRRWIGFDLGYAELAAERTRQRSLLEVGT